MLTAVWWSSFVLIIKAKEESSVTRVWNWAVSRC